METGAVLPINGVELGVVQAHIRKADRYDFVVLTINEGASVGAVFTQNQFCAAPVRVCRLHQQRGQPRALIINTGCANAGTGEIGIGDAEHSCRALSQVLGINPQAVWPFSTGVIMEPLPMDRYLAAIPRACEVLREDAWSLAATAIMTTDLVPKVISRRFQCANHNVTITGMAKGSGMIHPNMATLLGFIATDAAIEPKFLQILTHRLADQSFNRITVDGDTSTNDSFVLIATGKSGLPVMDSEAAEGFGALWAGLLEVAVYLAQAIVKDGEGATKFITIQVQEGLSEAECLSVARSIAHSPLVKTAFFASDPNLGRILAAVGNAPVPNLDVNQVRLYLDDVLVAEQGGRAKLYQEADGQRVMAQQAMTIRLLLGRGESSATLWTCDLSYDYVRINADYRS
ncbi:MAG: bifunctional glutamate N-acetyltransferase/amino-acid acetyltransferase ArgJ [Ferrovum sp.]|nr:bifunctional glutamate N-acetyltransferase/amino-acid acetyltransferase ArgJ [Ferrovum sp.]